MFTGSGKSSYLLPATTLFQGDSFYKSRDCMREG